VDSILSSLLTPRYASPKLFGIYPSLCLKCPSLKEKFRYVRVSEFEVALSLSMTVVRKSVASGVS